MGLKYLIVGGSFDENGGRPSGLIGKIHYAFKEYGNGSVATINGGNYNELTSDTMKKSCEWADVILWMANVPNHLEKVRDIKSQYPRKYLIMSKRNNGEYEFQELVNRALGQKANLILEFQKAKSGNYEMRVFDPLATVWCDYTDDVDVAIKKLCDRVNFITSITREPTRLEDVKPLEIPNEEKFFGLVKEYAEVFHELIAPEKGVTRFLGNSSFRCQRGFPSFRKDDIIYVSRRNVDKRYIGPSEFVATTLRDDGVYYWGPNKPSVDTPIQVRLYNEFPNINYMLHAHVYIDDAPSTTVAVPCGAIEEVDEILGLIDDRSKDYYEINLAGHGCLVMANNVNQLENLKYIARPMPEIINQK